MMVVINFFVSFETASKQCVHVMQRSCLSAFCAMTSNERTTTRLDCAKILLSLVSIFCAIFATTVSFARSRSVGISSQQFDIYCVFVAPSRLHYLAV